jgi:hypothetical protein
LPGSFFDNEVETDVLVRLDGFSSIVVRKQVDEDVDLHLGSKLPHPRPADKHVFNTLK